MPDVEIPCVQCKETFHFHRKRTGNLLSTQHDAAAAVPEMPLEKSSARAGRCEPAIRDRLRQLRQARSGAVSAKGRPLGALQRMSRSKPLTCQICVVIALQTQKSLYKKPGNGPFSWTSFRRSVLFSGLSILYEL